MPVPTHARGQVKLCDMGLARMCEKSRLLLTICGTHKYLAPELVQCDRGQLQGYDKAIDMWGAGLLAFIMLFGFNPFARESRSGQHGTPTTNAPRSPRRFGHHPTEAGALGAVGAMVLAAIEGGFSRSNLAKVCDETLRVTAMVMAILLGSTAFALVFRSLGGDAMIRAVLVNLPGGQLGFLVVSMAVIFSLGFFIDFFDFIDSRLGRERAVL